MTSIPRRAFVSGLARAGLGTAVLAAIPAWAREAIASGVAGGLIVRNDWPEHLETTLAALDSAFLTPNELFFARSHFPPPVLDVNRWRLEVAGLTRTPLSFSLAELGDMPRTEATHTLECAGNGRALYRLPSTSGTQWERGTVGTAKWGGVRMSNVLGRAGVASEAKHVWIEAADAAPMPATPRFLRSIPLEKAMRDTLLVLTMNGVPLPSRHGAPLRVIVPGWYGMASTKWVTRLRLESAPSDNHFMAKGYHYQYPGEDPANAAPVEELRVKSLITRPLDGARVATGTVHVQGFAWSGTAGVGRVEISTDDGTTWREVTLAAASDPAAWQRWATTVTLPPGASLTIMVRATDQTGETQPLMARPNAGGYGNNSIQRVTLRARG